MLELLRCGNYYRGRGGLSHREAKKKPATPKRSGRGEKGRGPVGLAEKHCNLNQQVVSVSRARFAQLFDASHNLVDHDLALSLISIQF